MHAVISVLNHLDVHAFRDGHAAFLEHGRGVGHEPGLQCVVFPAGGEQFGEFVLLLSHMRFRFQIE